jgi:hypothetical protein
MTRQRDGVGFKVQVFFAFFAVFLRVLCGQELLTAEIAKKSRKGHKETPTNYGLERMGQRIWIWLAFQNKNTASRIISGSMACL